MTFDYYSYNIAGHFASALINGDYSGLTDAEEKELIDFLASAPAEIEHWDIDGDGDNFTRCEVCDLHAMCVEARGYFRRETR